MTSVRVVETVEREIFFPRLEDDGEGRIIIRKLKSRETTSGNGKHQLKLDMAENRYKLNEE